MSLTIDQIDHFYDLMIPLLIHVNQETQTVSPEVMEKMEYFPNPQAEHDLRSTLWLNPQLIDDFLKKNPFDFPTKDLEIVAGWKNFRYGGFTFCKTIRGIGFFMAHEEPQHFYAVYPLFDPFKDIYPKIPVILHTALIPYQDVIIYDGSMAMLELGFTPSMRKEVSQWVVDADELGMIKTSLPELTHNPFDNPIQVKKTNKSVLGSFKTFLRREYLSDKIISRDLDTVQSLADFLVNQIDATATLRGINKAVYDQFMACLEGDIPRGTIVGLKRFFTFMKKTNRMEWALAQEILKELRSM